MRAIKYKSESDFTLKRNIIIIIEVAILLSLIIVMIGVFKSDFSPFKEEPSLYVTTQKNSIEYKHGLTFPSTEDSNNFDELYETQVITTVKSNQGNSSNIYNSDSSTNRLPDASGWSTAHIISKATEAVNKTKAYTGNLTVNHTEGFTANVTECSAGGIIRSVVDLMIGWVVKPLEETLVYQNGRTVNSEGETVPIILPKRNAFSLSESGVQSATIKQTANEYIINIKLVEENVGMYDIPKHNAGAIGYLDVANFDISFMEIDSADIVYKGSSIELRINAEGYVTYANYKIPLHIEGSAHKGSISGSATFEGEQTEEWRLNY